MSLRGGFEAGPPPSPRQGLCRASPAAVKGSFVKGAGGCPPQPGTGRPLPAAGTCRAVPRGGAGAGAGAGVGTGAGAGPGSAGSAAPWRPEAAPLAMEPGGSMKYSARPQVGAAGGEGSPGEAGARQRGCGGAGARQPQGETGSGGGSGHGGGHRGIPRQGWGHSPEPYRAQGVLRHRAQTHGEVFGGALGTQELGSAP